MKKCDEDDRCTRCGEANVYELYNDGVDILVLKKKMSTQVPPKEFFEFRIIDGNYNTLGCELIAAELVEVAKRLHDMVKLLPAYIEAD